MQMVGSMHYVDIILAVSQLCDKLGPLSSVQILVLLWST